MAIQQSLRHKALDALAQYRKASDEAEEERHLAAIEDGKQRVRKLLEKVLNLSVYQIQIEYHYDDRAEDVTAVIPSLSPHLAFSARRDHDLYTDSLLCGFHYTVPDSPEYEEWYENLANKRIQRTWWVHSWREVGEVVEEVGDETPVVQPWPSSDTPMVKKQRYNWLTLEMMNNSNRPFEVLHSIAETTANNPYHDMPETEFYTLVRYTDVGDPQ
jgi:hypothetical protein